MSSDEWEMLAQEHRRRTWRVPGLLENVGDDLSAECPARHYLPQRAIALSDFIRLLNKPGPRGKDVLPGR